AESAVGRLPSWWPLAALLAFAALVRLPTLGLQSFWFDEAFTPVHVLHPSIVASMETMAHTENTPPLWYVTIWVWTRIFGTGVVGMRLLSALAGIALVAVVYEIARELAGRRVAIVAGAITAANPLFVWYSQEARAYELYALTMALALLCFIRAERQSSARRMAAFALTGALALLTHYFAVFLLVPMSLWLLRRRERWRTAVPAVGAIAVVGIALIPLVLSQGGKGTQWIGEWALRDRVEAIPQYYLTGYSGAPLGRGIELLVALPLIAGLAYGLWRGLSRGERGAAIGMLALAACGVLIPILLALGGADYLAPRNLIGAMVPVTILLAAVIGAISTGRLGVGVAVLATLALLAICVDVDLSPRLQRGDWSKVAAAVTPGSRGAGGRVAVVTAHLGSAPIEYYAPSLRPASLSIRGVSEIDKVGYKPLLASATTPPAPGFRLVQRLDFNGELIYRFVSPSPRTLMRSALTSTGITAGETNVLASAAAANGG
ncbi:MAG: glycosyltransferase family 39 protein, partial [Solirubrobacteraceae bacterium]